MTYSAGKGEFPIGTSSRVLLLMWSLFLLGGFALAWRLEPDPRGYGTHESLGLPPCSFRALSGLPCPTCGMTTSFSHLTRGRLDQALAANAGGVALALVCAAQIPWCWCSALQGRLVGVSQPTSTLLAAVLTLAGIGTANWLWHVFRA